MTILNTKMIAFVTVMTVILVPVNAMAETIEFKDMTSAEIAEYHKVKSLFDEQNTLLAQQESIKKNSVDSNGKMSQQTSDEFAANDKRLLEIHNEIEAINDESRKQFTIDSKTEQKLKSAQEIIEKSKLNFLGSMPDSRTGTLIIEIPYNHDDGKNYKQLVQDLVGTDIPLKIKVAGPVSFDSCLSQKSACDPLIGGIKIAGLVDSTHAADCTISLPAVRNIFLGTEQGFITAGHCYSNGVSVRQPDITSSIVGQVTLQVFGGSCDCEFVKKTGTQGLNSAVYSGPNTSTSITAKIDPLNGDWVVMTAEASGVKIGKVINTSYDPPGTTLTGTTLINSFESQRGDSGAPITNLSNSFVYHGSVSGHVVGTGTFMIPWSHIKSNLNLQ